MSRAVRRARLSAAVLCAVTVLIGPRAWAMALEVHVSGCADVDTHEVERLLGLELAAVASSQVLRDTLQVDLACSSGRLRITVVDPVTHRPLQREVALGPPDPGRDRTIALLASQLVLTSWAESFLEHPQQPPPAPPPAQDGAAQRDDDRRPTPLTHDWEIVAQGGLRVRDWSAPEVDEWVAIRPSVGIGRARVLLAVAYERGAAQRAGGSIEWSMVSAGAGGGWRSERLGPVAFEAFAAASIVDVDARGQRASADFVMRAAQGVVGEAWAAAGPELFLGPVLLGLESQVGVTFPHATARDALGREVALGGLWAGLTLVVGGVGRTW